MTELLLWPFVAGIVLTAIHAWFGLHVLARGVVFADLSLAQLAALGLMVAIFAGHTMESGAAYAYALSFALAGAVLFALTRALEKRIQQEAIIGIVYAVSASLGVLALDRAPQGAEHVKQLLIGSILTVTPTEIAKTAGVYAVIGLLHFVLRRGLIEASFAPRHRHGLRDRAARRLRHGAGRPSAGAGDAVRSDLRTGARTRAQRRHACRPGAQRQRACDRQAARRTRRRRACA